MSEPEGEQAKIPTQVLEGLEFVRASGEAKDMFDLPRVAASCYPQPPRSPTQRRPAWACSFARTSRPKTW